MFADPLTWAIFSCRGSFEGEMLCATFHLSLSSQIPAFANSLQRWNFSWTVFANPVAPAVSSCCEVNSEEMLRAKCFVSVLPEILVAALARELPFLSVDLCIAGTHSLPSPGEAL